MLVLFGNYTELLRMFCSVRSGYIQDPPSIVEDGVSPYLLSWFLLYSSYESVS